MIRRQLAKLINLKDRRGNYDDSRIPTLKDKHKGRRCFIIGTGPSLNRTKLELLKNEICFGVNTLYKIKPDCNYWIVCDKILWNKMELAIRENIRTKILFFTEGISKILKRKGYVTKENEMIIRPLGSMNVWHNVSTDLDKGTYSGGTVVVQALQIAYYMGFTTVYLVGCDADYSGIHHFDGLTCAEIGDGYGRTLSGDVEYVLNAYQQCKTVFELNGRRIFNATVGGKLEVFERKNLEDIV